MSVTHFCAHLGHLTVAADRIAKKHGAWHINFTEPSGQRRGWFEAHNYGAPFDQRLANAVLDDILKAGGYEKLTKKRSKS